MTILETVKRNLSREVLQLKKNSPHIFFAVGVAGVIGGTVLACRATLKLDKTLEECRNDINDRKEFEEKIAPHVREVGGPENNYNKQMAKIYATNVARLVKLYAPAGTVMVVSIGLLSTSHVQLAKRNAALMSAYTLLQTAYENYRERVREELGTDKELEIYNDVIKKEGDIEVSRDPNKFSPYARFFDEGSTSWVKDGEINRLFVQCQQKHANDLLISRGHLFLNEAYDMLGIDRSRAGAVVGWVLKKDRPNYVDFGIFQERNSPFVNGWERNVLLDFNVDGVIYDKI